MSKILITGSAGFINSHLTDRLLAEGDLVASRGGLGLEDGPRRTVVRTRAGLERKHACIDRHAARVTPA